MYLKNNRLHLFFKLFLAIACLSPTNLIPGDFDDFDEAIDFDLTDEIIPEALNSDCTDDEVKNLVETIIADLDALCIFKQNFYLRTYQLNQRSLLDYGLFLPEIYSAQPDTVGCHFFYNQTTRKNFTRKSTAICKYIAVFSEATLQEIQRRIRDFNPGIELPDVVPLFANTTAQDRRTGFMFHGMHTWRDYRFRILFPVYYLESNLFLTPQEIDAIQAAFGVTDPVDDMKFARKNLISDQIGLGDMRLNVDFPFATTVHTTSKLGLQATIPTAFAFKKGLYGSTFTSRCRGPILDFCNLFREINNPALIEAQVAAFALAALDQFNANIIQLPMGNGGHLGLGVYLRSKTKMSSLISRPWAQHMTMRSRISAEYLFARRQNRYFIECGDAGFEALGLNRAKSVILEDVEDNPAYARAVLAFLETQFTDNIFPFSLSTRVRPGAVLRWMTKYMYEGGNDWGWYLGTDNWLLTPEKLSGIKIPEGIPKSLNINIATKPFAYQFGLIGSLFWKRKNNLTASLNGQYNFGSVGIGDDFLISINIEKTF